MKKGNSAHASCHCWKISPLTLVVKGNSLAHNSYLFWKNWMSAMVMQGNSTLRKRQATLAYVGVSEIWIDLSGFSRREELDCPDVKCMLSGKALKSNWRPHSYSRKGIQIDHYNKRCKNGENEFFSANKVWIWLQNLSKTIVVLFWANNELEAPRILSQGSYRDIESCSTSIKHNHNEWKNQDILTQEFSTSEVFASGS